jgi:FkbM family methyltransferase
MSENSRIKHQFEDSIQEWSTPKRIQVYDYLKDKNITTYIDIGANTGGSILAIYEHLKPTCILGFEPDVDNYEYLLNTTYGIPNKYIYNNGIYYGLKSSKVYGTGDQSAGGYMITMDDQYKPVAYLEYDGKVFTLNTLEDIITANHPEIVNKIDLIKIDVEGSEYNIIEHSTLLKESRYLFIEFHVSPQEYCHQFIQHHLSNYEIVIENFHEFLLKRK